MKHGDPKERIRNIVNVVFTVLAVFIICEIPVPALASNGCHLRYKQRVDDRPLLFAVVSAVSGQEESPGSGLCRIGPSENESRTDRHTKYKYEEEFDPEEAMGGLSIDGARGELLYWARPANLDHSRLYRLADNDSQSWQPLLEQPDDFRETALDWASRNLYLLMGSRDRLVAVHVPEGGGPARPWTPSVILEGRAQITALALHPNRGYLFLVETGFTWRGGAHSCLLRAHLDGSSLTELRQQRSFIGDLAVDEVGERLYWSIPGQGMVQHSRLDGSDVKSVRGLQLHSAALELASRALTLDRHYLYYLESPRLVKRFEKASGNKDDEFQLENDGPDMSEIVVVTSRSQRPSRDHPCANATRGGCDKYCFAVPNGDGNALVRMCKCGFGDVLGADGVSCSRKRLPNT